MIYTCTLAYIVGWKDKRPRELVGELFVTVVERGGRSVRVAMICDATQPRPELARLWEPQILAMGSGMIELQGYEYADGRWTLQQWRCDVPNDLRQKMAT